MGGDSGQDRVVDLGWRRRDLLALLLLSALALLGVLWPLFTDDPPEGGARARASRVRQAAERIDPNTASPASLQRLPDVGPVLAGAIVADRQAHPGQPFTCPEDLARVKGIGPGTVERLRPYLTFPAARQGQGDR